MEVAVGMMGLSLTLLGIILAYIWRANGRYIRELREAQERMARAQERMARELMEGQRAIMEGQKEIARGIGEVAKIAHEILKEVRTK